MRYGLLLLLAGVLAGESATAQMSNTHSPYSRFGLGLQEHQAYSGTMGFGGVSLGVAQKSAVNPANPASYGQLDSMTFLFDFGIQGGYSLYSTPEGSMKNAGQANVQHLAIRFPLAHGLGMALGFQPYSKLGYDVTRYETDLRTISEVGRVRYHHTGSGGVNEAFLGIGYTAQRYFSIGLNAHYRFGSINHKQDLYVPSNATFSEYTSERRYVLKSVMLRGGIQARIPLDSAMSKSLVMGITVDFYPYVYAEQRMEAMTTYMNASMQLAQDVLAGQKRMQLPLRYGAGAVYESRRWLGGFDFIYEHWDSFSWFGRVQGLQPLMEVRLGAQYTPDAASLRWYSERMSYRLGAMFTQLPMRLGDQRVYDAALTVGLGMPIGWHRWMGNIALEIGRRGPFGKKVVSEMYYNLHLGIAFIDTWFFKRKYD